MIVCVFGSRSWRNPKVIAHYAELVVDLLISPQDTILTGGAPGIDTWVHDAALTRHRPTRVDPADWSTGKSAGFIRNGRMASDCDRGIAIWNSSSPGTKHMIFLLKRLHKPCLVLEPETALR